MASVHKKTRTVELAFSSELPVLRRGFFSDDFNEILDHSPKSVRLGRLNDGASLLFNHDRNVVFGVVEHGSIDSDRRGRAVVRFGKSARANEAFGDVEDGILGKVSVGYVIHEAELTKHKSEPDTLRAIDWEPVELSIVSVPADTSVGVGRDIDIPETIIISREATTMPTKKHEDTQPSTPTVVELTPNAGDKLRQEERARIQAIQTIANGWAMSPTWASRPSGR